MMFKGTQFRADGEFDRLLDEAGAEGQNAFTSHDHTAYVEELPIESLELVASLESERMRGLLVDEKAFKTERDVVQNERRMRTENSPDGTLYQELFNLAFEKQSYRWPVIGYARDLEQMNAQDAREFYDRWYRPNNATLVIVGDVNPAAIHSLVESKYGSFEAGMLPARNDAKDAVAKIPRRLEMEMNIQADKLMMGYPVPEALHGDTPAILLLDAILAAGNSSRLHRALVETGVASSVYGYPLMNVAPSLYIVGAALQSGHRASEAEEIILNEISKLTWIPPTQAEIERALNQMEFSFFEGLNSNAEIAGFLGQAETDLGSFEREFEFRNALKKVSATDIQKVAGRWLRKQGRSTVIGTPKKTGKMERKK
jgi:zinc protease